jgi:hypothetical protein
MALFPSHTIPSRSRRCPLDPGAATDETAAGHMGQEWPPGIKNGMAEKNVFKTMP